MKTRFRVIAPRSEIAIYYGWAYGIRYARELLDNLTEVSPGFYVVRNPDNNINPTKKYCDNFANDMRCLVVSHKARMNKKLTNPTYVYVDAY